MQFCLNRRESESDCHPKIYDNVAHQSKNVWFCYIYYVDFFLNLIYIFPMYIEFWVKLKFPLNSNCGSVWISKHSVRPPNSGESDSANEERDAQLQRRKECRNVHAMRIRMQASQLNYQRRLQCIYYAYLISILPFLSFENCIYPDDDSWTSISIVHFTDYYTESCFAFTNSRLIRIWPYIIISIIIIFFIDNYQWEIYYLSWKSIKSEDVLKPKIVV